MTSLRRRMVTAVGVAVSLAFLVSGIVVVLVMRASLNARFDDALVREADALANLVEQDNGEIESEIPRAWFADRARVIELHTDERAPTENAIVPITLPDGRSARQITLHFVPRHDEPTTTPRTATLVIARVTDEVDDTITRIALVLLFAGVAGALACLLASRWLVGYSLAPLRTLATRIAEIRETDLAVRVADASTPLEVQPLVARLDELLERLERAFSRERELTAEVAHELRTPIAGLRTTIELALDRERPADRYRTALADCLAITLQTQRVVDVLLSLARLDASAATSPAASVDVDEIARAVLEQHAARAAERGLTVDAALSSTTVRADAEHLRVVLDNAIENAVSYATEGTAIRVSTRGSRIEIANATSLDPADAPRVFERFWRGDRARTAGTHAGLGLALCKKLVERMRGRIGASVSNETFTLTIELPAETTAPQGSPASS